VRAGTVAAIGIAIGAAVIRGAAAGLMVTARTVVRQGFGRCCYCLESERQEARQLRHEQR
jgi:hypothetical protein